MYLVNFKLVASGVDSLVAQDYVDISTCALIKSGSETVVLHLQGTDGAGGLLNDTITITMQGTAAEKQANVDIVAAELARMVNRSKHVGIQHSNKLETVGANFMNTKAASVSATAPGIVTLTTVVDA